MHARTFCGVVSEQRARGGQDEIGPWMMKVVDVFRCGVLKDYRTWDREGGRGWCSVCRALLWRRSATVRRTPPRRAETRGRSDKVKERRARIEVIALSDGGAPGEERYPSIVPAACRRRAPHGHATQRDRHRGSVRPRDPLAAEHDRRERLW